MSILFLKAKQHFKNTTRVVFYSFMSNELKQRQKWYQLEENNPFDLPKETPKAYQAFDIYLKFGIERSITKVAQKLDKSKPQIAKWSKKYNWLERAESYDRWKFDQEIINHEQKLKDDAEAHNQDWIKRRIETRNYEYEIGMKMVDISKRYLEMFDKDISTLVFTKKETKNRFDKDGNFVEKIEITTFENGFTLLDEVCNLTEIAFRLLYNSTNFPIENAGNSQIRKLNFSQTNIHISNEDLMNLSDKENIELLESLEKKEKELIQELMLRDHEQK